MSKALAHPTLFAATGLLFAVATFINMTYPSSEATSRTAMVSPAHATPMRASAPVAPPANRSNAVVASKF